MDKEYKCYRCGKSFLRHDVSLWKQTHFPDSVQCICRQCVREKQRDYRKNGRGKEAENEASKRAYQNHKYKWQARAKLRYAVKNGSIEKPQICEVCGEKKPLDGHHPDYSKPLEVNWLCQKHHRQLHSRLKITTKDHL